jgi:hypothetical protein
MMVAHVDRLIPFREQLGTSGFRREEYGQFQRNNCERRATVKKCEADHMSQDRPFAKEIVVCLYRLFWTISLTDGAM